MQVSATPNLSVRDIASDNRGWRRITDTDLPIRLRARSLDHDPASGVLRIMLASARGPRNIEAPTGAIAGKAERNIEQ